MIDLQLTTRRWTIRIARRTPDTTKTSAPSNAPTPMRINTGFTQPRRATKDIR